MKAAELADSPIGRSVVELERQLDPLLRNRESDRPFCDRLQAMVREWSRSIWTAAEALGPSPLEQSEIDYGFDLAQCPVFVCGAARSGTTLLRDLLDGHPQLVVVPTESLFYTFLEPALAGLGPGQHSAYLARRWLERLVAPPPYWLLGCSTRGQSPYVDFARNFAGWGKIAEHRKGARIVSWPLAAFALAYAQWLGGGRLPRRACMWVEKTPGSERFLDRIWQDFPQAKVIQIVRQPEAVLASIKTLKPQAWSRRRTLVHIVRQMAPSYRIAANNARRRPGERYCLVRYEDLTASPDTVMARVSAFLGIDLLPCLLEPTVALRPAANNTSFGGSRPDVHNLLEPIDRVLLAVAVARQAAKLGYARAEPSASAQNRVVGAPKR